MEQVISHIENFDKVRKIRLSQFDFGSIIINIPTYLNSLEIIKRFNEVF